MNHKEILDCIKDRRSVRAYLPDPIGEEALAPLLDAAVWAPSGTNRQSWLFTAILNKETLTALNDAVKESLLRTVPDNAPKQHAQAAAKKEGYSFFYQAPALIVASSEEQPNAIADCACALQNIFLVAHAMGLGSCWINQLRWLTDDGPVRDFLAGLGLPKEHLICGAAAVGYPAQEPKAPPRKEGTVRVIR